MSLLPLYMGKACAERVAELFRLDLHKARGFMMSFKQDDTVDCFGIVGLNMQQDEMAELALRCIVAGFDGYTQTVQTPETAAVADVAGNLDVTLHLRKFLVAYMGFKMSTYNLAMEIMGATPWTDKLYAALYIGLGADTQKVDGATEQTMQMTILGPGGKRFPNAMDELRVLPHFERACHCLLLHHERSKGLRGEMVSFNVAGRLAVASVATKTTRILKVETERQAADGEW